MLAPFNIPQFLRSQPLFVDVDEAALLRLAAECRLATAALGDPVLWAGQRCDAVFIVARGQVRLYMTAPNGNEKVIELVGPGQSFAEALVFMARPCPVHAQALQDTLLVQVPRQALLQEVQHDAAFAMGMLAGLSRRLHGLVQDVQASALQSGLQRVVGYLLRDVDPDEPGPAVVSLPAQSGLRLASTVAGQPPQAVPRLTMANLHASVALGHGLTLRAGIDNVTNMRLAARSSLFSWEELPRSCRIGVEGRW